MHTVINIEDRNYSYPYIIEYIKTDKYIDKVYYHTPENNSPYSDIIGTYHDNISIWLNGEGGYLKNYNHWYKKDVDKNDVYSGRIKLAKIRLYFPLHSVETYKTGLNYALTLNTWINGRNVVLGSFIFTRGDSYSCDKIYTFINRQYYECIEFDIVDPYDLIYSDEWSGFRSIVCHEPNSENNTGSILNASLHMVEYDVEGYKKTLDFGGGQNSINISNDTSDYLNLIIHSNTSEELMYNEQPSIICDLNFNHVYKGDLKDYLYETYNIKHDVIRLKYSLIIRDEDNLYSLTESPLIDITDNPDFNYKFSKNDISNSGNFISWQGWKEGMGIICYLEISDENNESLININSNILPFTQDLYRYFVNTDMFEGEINGSKISHVNLNEVNMKLININTVNKTQNIIIQNSNDKISDSRSEILQPVFYRTAPISHIVIHTSINDVICINLDIYKSAVKRFVLKIDGKYFSEIGRTSAGVLFKIPSNQISQISSYGDTYYILDQDYNYVADGKYSCI